MTRSELRQRIVALIEAPPDPATRDALIEDLARWQAKRVIPYGRLAWGNGLAPALAADVFRFARVAAHAPEQDVRVFRSSGTTAHAPSLHFFRELGLYDLAAQRVAREMLFADGARTKMIILAPHERQAPGSSLSYMLSRFETWFGREATWAWSKGTLDMAGLTRALEHASRRDEPVVLLGTSFAFVHAEDALGSRRFELPRGSRLMQTGGFKGRSRQIDPAELRRALCTRYHLRDPMVISEYGMTEMSSQLYETTLRDHLLEGNVGPRRLQVPHWVRVTPVDPESLAPVPKGERGILRIDDCANLDSVCCIQTADLGRAVADGIELIGRAPGAIPRGCSLGTEIALGSGAP